MMKKFIERKPKQGTLFIPSDVIAKDLKKITLDKKGTNFTSGLQKKLFGGKLIDEKKKKKKKKKMKEVKALTAVKENTRTLAMVLRSEREILSGNKELQLEIEKLNSLLEDKRRVVSLVSSLTGQLQCLAEGLAEVKAEKYSSSASARLQRHNTSPKTPYNQKVSTNSLFSSSGFTTPASPDDVFLEDLNPCLTPYCIKENMKNLRRKVMILHLVMKACWKTKLRCMMMMSAALVHLPLSCLKVPILAKKRTHEEEQWSNKLDDQMEARLHTENKCPIDFSSCSRFLLEQLLS
ncbi:hypothetical protein ACFE04_007943 [Oxalis oulophora]